MICAAEARTRARRCADTLATQEPVLAVDVLAPGTDPTGLWTIDLVLAGSANGLPHPVLDTLGSYQMTVRSVDPQGPHWQAIATA